MLHVLVAVGSNNFKVRGRMKLALFYSFAAVEETLSRHQTVTQTLILCLVSYVMGLTITQYLRYCLQQGCRRGGGIFAASQIKFGSSLDLIECTLIFSRQIKFKRGGDKF